MFPSWMRNSIKNHTNPSSLVPAIQRFFKEQGIERLSIPVPSARKRRSEEENRVCKKYFYKTIILLIKLFVFQIIV
jgi:hypothetical protein